MAKKPSAYEFTYDEIAAMMMKSADIHTGLWQLVVRFRLGAGTVGPSPDQSVPTGFVGIEKLGLQSFASPGGAALPPLVYDAAELNPADKSPA